MLYIIKSLLECGAAVAQVTVNHLVAGSNPAIPAKIALSVMVAQVVFITKERFDSAAQKSLDRWVSG